MVPASHFHVPHFGRERLDRGLAVPRHRHWDGYITIVLAGGYQEAGFDGRRNLAAGDAVVHSCFDAHLDYIGPNGTELINLPLPRSISLPPAFKINNLDAIVRLAETCPTEAARALRPFAELPGELDWPDEVAATLISGSPERLSQCADSMGIAAETLSRGFRAAYGVTPVRFRAEARARRAMHLILHSEAGLACIALDCGYSDQPHLNRAILQLTGTSPGRWRRSNSFKKSERASR